MHDRPHAVRRFTGCALSLIALCICAAPWSHAETKPRDITPQSKLQVSSNPGEIYHLVDDDPTTFWLSDAEDDQYVDVTIPTSEGTLSVLWTPGSWTDFLTLEQYIDETWVLVASHSYPGGMPQTFTFPPRTARIRLRWEGQMGIAELRVHRGSVTNLFHDYDFTGADRKIVV